MENREAELPAMNPAELVVEMLRAYFPGLDLSGVALPRRRGRTARRREAGSERQDGRRPRGEPKTAEGGREPDPLLARCYADLGVPYGADFQQVRRAWRRLMRQHHPDLQGGDAERQRIGTEQAKRFNNAFAEIVRRLRGGQGESTHA